MSKVEKTLTPRLIKKLWLAFIFLAIGPVIGLFNFFGFESRRWSESMFGGTS